MSIVDSYDESQPLITPESLYSGGNIAEKCIVTFSHKVLENIMREYECNKEVSAGTANGKIPVYSLIAEKEKILLYMSPIGSACAGCIMDEVSFMTGAKKFIVFGTCGSLDNEKTTGKLIIPTESYRDEGFSYHYLKACDYITITNSSRLANIFDEMGLPYVCGRNWTTDAIYRETEMNIKRRKSDGCISVEMESAGLQALCTYKKLDFYTFFFASDLVDSEVWKNINLGTKEEKQHQLNCFKIALNVAKRL